VTRDVGRRLPQFARILCFKLYKVRALVCATPADQMPSSGHLAWDEKVVVIAGQRIDVRGDRHAGPAIDGRTISDIGEKLDINLYISPAGQPLVQWHTILDRVEVDYAKLGAHQVSASHGRLQ
jgi:hypothetical protein